MDSERPDLRTSLKALAAHDRRTLTAHLEPEQLLAYRAGELPEGEVEALRDHLALCPECAELLLDLDDFTPDASPVSKAAISDQEIEAAWIALRDRLAREGQPPAKTPSGTATRPDPREAAAPPKRPLPFAPPARRRSPGLAYALAASLAACLGLSVWVGVLSGKGPSGVTVQAQGSAAQPHVRLAPALRLHRTRGGQSRQEFHLHGGSTVVLEFQLPSSLPGGGYRVRLVRLVPPEPVFEAGPFAGNPEEVVRVPLVGVTAGDYRMKVFAAAQQEESIADFDFRIAEP